jgi:hypothetical protein
MLHLHEQDIQRLVNFNEVVGMLASGNFFKNRKMVLTISFKGGKRTSYKGATEESLKAFVLDYRKIFQEKDDISYKKIETLYKKLSEQEYFKKFKDIKGRIDNVLDQKTNVTTDNYTWTYRDVHDMFIKGHIAHLQSKNVDRIKYLETKKNKNKYVIFERHLERMLKQIFNHLVEMKKINEEILKQLLGNR